MEICLSVWYKITHYFICDTCRVIKRHNIQIAIRINLIWSILGPIITISTQPWFICTGEPANIEFTQQIHAQSGLGEEDEQRN